MSYDGPPSDVDEELDWEREIEETQLEGQMPLGHEMEAESRELYSGVLEEMYADAPYNVPGGGSLNGVVPHCPRAQGGWGWLEG